MSNQVTTFSNNATPAAINLGTCWGTPSGQDLSMPSYMASGNQCVAEAVLRRWTTSPGELIYDPTYGRNLIDLISDDLTPAQLAYEQQQAAAQAELDERVLRCLVTLTLLTSGVLNVVANIVTAAGPFKFVAAITQLAANGGAAGVQLLLVTP